MKLRRNQHLNIFTMFFYFWSSFLPRDASAERGYEIAFVCPSVRPSVCDVLVSATHRLEFFENNFMAE